MVRIQNTVIDTEDFYLQLDHQGVMQLSVGPMRVSMSLDSAYGLQYQLAEFLADLELEDYSSDPVQKDSSFSESQEVLKHFSSHKRQGRLDA